MKKKFIETIVNFVYHSAGAELDLIKISPSKERSTFQLIGLMNLTITILAFGSFTLIIFCYAKEIETLKDQFGTRLFWAIGLSLIIAIIVYFTNRLFIGSIKKNVTDIRLFLENIPKILLMAFNAIVIGIAYKYIIFGRNAEGETFLDKYLDAMDRVSKNPAADRIELFINIFYLLLTISPILIRLLSPKGIYDFMLTEKEEREFYASFNPQGGKLPINDSNISTGTEEENFRKKTLAHYLNKEELKEKIAKNLTQEAVSTLLNHIHSNSEFYNELILFSARLEFVNKQKRSGIISEEKYTQERNTINFHMLELTDKIIG